MRRIIRPILEKLPDSTFVKCAGYVVVKVNDHELIQIDGVKKDSHATCDNNSSIEMPVTRDSF